MEPQIDPLAERQLRGLLLRLLFVNHNMQQRRLTSTMLDSVLKREGHQFTREDVVTQLQDLKDRGYVRFEQVRMENYRVHLFNIEITSIGRDVFVGNRPDPMIMTVR